MRQRVWWTPISILWPIRGVIVKKWGWWYKILCREGKKGNPCYTSWTFEPRLNLETSDRFYLRPRKGFCQ